MDHANSSIHSKCAIANVVILADAPRDNVRGVDDGVPLRSDDAGAAESAPVIVVEHDGPAKTLVAGGGLVVDGKHLLRGGKRMRRFLQDAGIPERLPMEAALLAQCNLAGLGKARAQQRTGQRRPPSSARHVHEQGLVEIGPKRHTTQL